MATFLVERYWPGLDPASVQAATDRLLASGVLVVETIVASVDEVCYWYVAAGSADDVERTFRTAGVRLDRVAAATALGHGHADADVPS
jgi:hypothetical protein